MYSHLLCLVASATQYITIHDNCLSICETTIKRIDSLISVYGLEQLHPNTAALFYFQACIVYCLHGKKKKALARLEYYLVCVEDIIENPFLHSDSYFNAIDPWFEQLDIGSFAPRDKNTIIKSAIESLSHPALAIIKDTDTYIKITKTLLRKGESL